MFAGLTAAVALRRTSFGSDSRNTFFHAEPTCLTIGNARCPLLMVVAEHTMAPTGPALAVAARAPLGELYRSRGGHYDVYAGGLDHENVLRVETSFLHRHCEMPDH
jgi:hypothetical protein